MVYRRFRKHQSFSRDSMIDTFIDTEIQKETFLSGHVRVHGNKTVIDNIIKMTRLYIGIGKGLYETQELLKQVLTDRYGEQWYEDSGDAINYIIENEYAAFFYNGGS